MRYLFLSLLLCSPYFMAQEPDEVFVDDYDESEYDNGESYARFTYADKYTFVTHEDDDEEQVVRNLPATSGDFLKTRTASYAEVEFIDGSLMQIADRTHVEFQAINEIYNNESLSVFKLYKGSLFLHVTDEWTHSDRRVFRVDSEDGSVYIEAPGIYRVDREQGTTKLKVFRGFAEISGEHSSEPVYSGEYSTVRNMRQPARTRTFNSFYGDRFERWAYERRPRTGSVSSSYVDNSISSYSRDLDDHGEWRYNDDYSTHVWVPTVNTSWRPYNHGYWTPRHGRLTWVSYDPFGWVTHHYGRWGWSVGLGWYWIPGYRYSPAWVAWSSYDSYLGWCPLGYWNRPYYYFRNRRNTVIFNHHSYRWRYVSSLHIVQRQRHYVDSRIIHRGKRHITTRRLALEGRGYRSAARLNRAARDASFNREIASNRGYRRGTIAVRNNQGRIERTAIRGARTGTRTVVQHSPRITNSRGHNNASVGRGSRGVNSRGNVTRSETNTSRTQTNRSAGTRGNSRSSATRGNTGSSRSEALRGTRSGTSRSNANRDTSSRGSSSRSNATRGTKGSSRSNATRGSSSRGNDSRPSATRGNQGSSSRSNATRGTKGNSSRPNATRGTKGNSSRSNATRGTKGNSSRPSATRGTKGNSSRPNATRGNSSRSNQPRSSANRSSGNSSRSSANQGNSSRSNSSRTSATRSSGGSNSRSSATRSSGGSNSRSSATRSSGGSNSRSSATRSSGGSNSRSSATRSSGGSSSRSSANRSSGNTGSSRSSVRGSSRSSKRGN